MQETKSPPYQLISVFSILILVIVTWGFFRTYLVFFPDFKGFNMAQHFHGAMLMIWMLMLIVQPLLIRSGRIKLHKAIGKSSYIIAPLVALSILMVAKMRYLMPEPQFSQADKVAGLSLPLPAMIAFAIFYSLAIINKKNTYVHLRYMIGTALLMIGPGLGRALIIYFSVPFPVSVTSTLILATIISVTLALIDAIRRKGYTAFAVITLVNLLCLLAWSFRMGEIWQTIGSWFAAIFNA
ncbi:MAG: hypothetical protein ACK5OP_03040 [Sphingobacteriales bacterium]|jgi:hypothetical protein